MRLQLFFRPGGVNERGLAHGGWAECKAVVLFEPVAAFGKRVLRAKVAQNPLKPAGFAARADARLRAERPQILDPRRLPDALWDAERPIDAPPSQKRKVVWDGWRNRILIKYYKTINEK